MPDETNRITQAGKIQNKFKEMNANEYLGPRRKVIKTDSASWTVRSNHLSIWWLTTNPGG